MRVEVKRKNYLARGILFFAVIYTIVSVISLQMKISDARLRLMRLQEQLSVQQQENAVLDDLLAADEKEQAEQAARDKLGLVYPEERVYVDVS